MKFTEVVFSKVVLVIFGVEALLGVLILIAFYSMDSEKVSYCNSIQEMIEATNNGQLRYWTEVKGIYDATLMSPVSVQTALYEDYNRDDIINSYLFKDFRNGYKSWNKSGVKDPSIEVFYPDNAEMVKDVLGDCEYLENAVYAVTRVVGEVSSLGYKVNDSYIIPISDTYDMIIGEYTWSTTGDEVRISIEPFAYQCHGTVERLLGVLQSEDSSVIFFSELKIDCEVDERADVVFTDDYEFYIRNRETGLIVLCGKR